MCVASGYHIGQHRYRTCHHIKFCWTLLYYGGNTYALSKYLLNISQVLNTILAKETPQVKYGRSILLGALEKNPEKVVFEDRLPEKGH